MNESLKKSLAELFTRRSVTMGNTTWGEVMEWFDEHLNGSERVSDGPVRYKWEPVCTEPYYLQHKDGSYVKVWSGVEDGKELSLSRHGMGWAQRNS